MNIFKALAISFSLYSRIPMPQFDWGDKDMKYSLIFFPWVGLVIAGLDYGWYELSVMLGLSTLITTIPLIIIPLLVTGGFHIDGYMDVEDALKSYATTERKLEIMKDPHIGAFAVIRLVTTGLVYLTSVLIIISYADEKVVLCLGVGYVLARALSGISVIKFNQAKKDGMLKKESEVDGNGVLIALIITAVLTIGFMLCLDVVSAIVVGVVALVSLSYYQRKSDKEFGGVTGDTSGYFVVICEVWMAVALAVVLCIRQYISF